MSDDVMSSRRFPLHGEKVSVATPSLTPADVTLQDVAAAGRELMEAAVVVGQRALAERRQWLPVVRPAMAFAGVVALWAAPVLLLSRYQPEQLFDALVRVSLRPSASDLLTLSLVVTYFVLTGLMLGRVTCLAQGSRPRVLLRCAVAPFVVVSAVATLIAAVPLFFGALVFCFPQLV